MNKLQTNYNEIWKGQSQNPFEIVPNGYCQSNTGERTVVFSPEGELRPIFHWNSSGVVPGRGTTQMKFEGDIVISCKTYSRSDPGICEVNEESYPIWAFEGAQIDLPFEISEEIFDWLLKHTGRQESYLPGFQGKSYVTYTKFKKLEKFTKTYGIKVNFEEFARTPKKYINLVPVALDFNADNYIGEVLNATGTATEINQTETWFGSDGLGNCSRLETPMIKKEIDHGMKIDRIIEPDGKGIPNWRRFDFLIKVKYGCIISNHYSKGVEIQVYKT